MHTIMPVPIIPQNAPSELATHDIHPATLKFLLAAIDNYEPALAQIIAKMCGVYTTHTLEEWFNVIHSFAIYINVMVGQGWRRPPNHELDLSPFNDQTAYYTEPYVYAPPGPPNWTPSVERMGGAGLMRVVKRRDELWERRKEYLLPEMQARFDEAICAEADTWECVHAERGW